MRLSITFNVVILLEWKFYCQYFWEWGLEESLCVEGSVADGYVLHTHAYLQKEYKMGKKKLQNNRIESKGQLFCKIKNGCM